MNKTILTLALVSSMTLSACMQMSESDRRDIGGATVGGAIGLITAKALGANNNWTILSTLAGSAAGVMVARNQATGECAYSNGDGTYRTGPCPT
ncbi:glucose-6-phosphate isomerase [Aquicoccus porphyridii]|uniref:Glucose-6-phosphate isomerase n=1 Tax=Aquicoccus porphyridii TaxID=1852029 RepID=A0A5A9ZT81_9RHOB|nr:glucose-6-phosphate isomerase [Aquicoccus porphyridii]KAA0920281.1 glucose-6-phosphate isomerase [Aquicoccus porphyridii]RAI54923.1 glucose-6-phosphate isomerase [Rhodobacteraceae bacterium AsT-22]